MKPLVPKRSRQIAASGRYQFWTTAAESSVSVPSPYETKIAVAR
jgi:hypothetical protein